jgi:hypothetical protein
LIDDAGGGSMQRRPHMPRFFGPPKQGSPPSPLCIAPLTAHAADPAAGSAATRCALLRLFLQGGRIAAIAPILPFQGTARLCAAILDRRDTAPAPPFSTAVNTAQRLEEIADPPPSLIWPSDRHRQADGCGEIFLPEIEREEPFGFESDGGSGVEDIEAPVPARQGVRGRKTFGLVDHGRQVGRRYHEPARRSVRLELAPENRR